MFNQIGLLCFDILDNSMHVFAHPITYLKGLEYLQACHVLCTMALILAYNSLCMAARDLFCKKVLQELDYAIYVEANSSAQILNSL